MKYDYSVVFQKAWEIMSIEFTINGFTTSYAEIFIFSLLVILVVRAIFVYFLFAD